MKAKEFKSLHQQETPLLICNVWDAASAKTAETLGFSAIGTSSAAVAKMLGYNDGEEIPFEELLYLVNRIAKASSLPLTVDIEAGYSDDPVVTAQHIKSLAGAGVVGINIEDSRVEEGRIIKDAEQFAGYLFSVTALLKKQEIEIFINVRTDTFLLGMETALNETIKRAKLYESAGADGLFVPCITSLSDIEAITVKTDLPVNVMCMPELADFDSVAKSGAKRISMGNFIFDKMLASLKGSLEKIKQDNSFRSVF